MPPFCQSSRVRPTVCPSSAGHTQLIKHMSNNPYSLLIIYRKSPQPGYHSQGMPKSCQPSTGNIPGLSIIYKELTNPVNQPEEIITACQSLTGNFHTLSLIHNTCLLPVSHLQKMRTACQSCIKKWSQSVNYSQDMPTTYQYFIQSTQSLSIMHCKLLQPVNLQWKHSQPVNLSQDISEPLNHSQVMPSACQLTTGNTYQPCHQSNGQAHFLNHPLKMPKPCQSFTGNIQSLSTIHTRHLQIVNMHRQHAQSFCHPQDMSTACQSSIANNHHLKIIHRKSPQTVNHAQAMPKACHSPTIYDHSFFIIYRKWPQTFNH